MFLPEVCAEKQQGHRQRQQVSVYNSINMRRFRRHHAQVAERQSKQRAAREAGRTWVWCDGLYWHQSSLQALTCPSRPWCGLQRTATWALRAGPRRPLGNQAVSDGAMGTRTHITTQLLCLSHPPEQRPAHLLAPLGLFTPQAGAAGCRQRRPNAPGRVAEQRGPLFMHGCRRCCCCRRCRPCCCCGSAGGSLWP